jgi:hypothetical protein
LWRIAKQTPVINPAVAETARGKTTRSPTRVGSGLPNSLLQNERSEWIQPLLSLSVLVPDPESDMNPSFKIKQLRCCIDYGRDFGEAWAVWWMDCGSIPGKDIADDGKSLEA